MLAVVPGVIGGGGDDGRNSGRMARLLLELFLYFGAGCMGVLNLENLSSCTLRTCILLVCILY